MPESLSDRTKYIIPPRITQKEGGVTEVFWICNQLQATAEHSAVVLFLDEVRKSSVIVLSQSRMKQQVILSSIEGATRLLGIEGIKVDAGRGMVSDLQSLMLNMARVTYTYAFSHPSSEEAIGKMTDFDFNLVAFDGIPRRVRLVVDPIDKLRQVRTRSLIGVINNVQAADGQRAVLEHGLWIPAPPRPRKLNA